MAITALLWHLNESYKANTLYREETAVLTKGREKNLPICVTLKNQSVERRFLENHCYFLSWVWKSLWSILYKKARLHLQCDIFCFTLAPSQISCFLRVELCCFISVQKHDAGNGAVEQMYVLRCQSTTLVFKTDGMIYLTYYWYP